MNYFLLVLLFALLEREIAATGVVVVAEGSETEFICTGNLMETPHWFLNETFIFADSLQAQGIKETPDRDEQGNLQSILSVTGNAAINNSELHCEVEENTTQQITLHVQGLLSSPGNFTSVHDTNTIQLQWSPPFSLNITDIDPDISGYILYIQNINTSQSLEVNTTELEYIFTGLPGEDQPNLCHIYSFSVAAVNVVGEGGLSNPVQDYFPGEPYKPEVEGVLISNIEGEEGSESATVQLVVQVNTSCRGRIPTSLEGTITVLTMGSQLITNFTHIIPKLSEDGVVTFNAANIQTSSGQCLAIAKITAHNIKGSSPLSDDITLDCRQNSTSDQENTTLGTEDDDSPAANSDDDQLPVIAGTIVGAVIVVGVIVVLSIIIVVWLLKRKTGKTSASCEDNEYVQSDPAACRGPVSSNDHGEGMPHRTGSGTTTGKQQYVEVAYRREQTAAPALDTQVQYALLQY